MNPDARQTIKALESHGVKVIPFDSSGIMQGGTNGITDPVSTADARPSS